MAFIETPMGWALLALLGIGSPALGYIALRTIFSNAGNWNAWKRILGAAIIGLGWTIAITSILFSSNNEINFIHAGEFFALAGMGFILLVGASAFVTRGVHALLQRAPAVATATMEPSFREETTTPMRTPPARSRFDNVELQDDNAFAEKLSDEKTKPAKIRNTFTPASTATQEGPSFSGAWEPSMQEGLGLLKEEATPKRAETAARAATPKTTSLDAQLEQLKKDIKAFNASASKGMHPAQ